MFTGLIEDVGIMKKMVVSGDHGHIFVDTTIDTSSLKKGESIAVNGICLTVTDVSHGSFSADLSPETYKKTALRHAKPGSPLNLERSLRLTDRLGGHLVTGHIDGTGTVDQITKKEHFSEIVIMVDTSLEKYTVKKGSIAVDGISLTISDLVRGGISVSLIPFTYFHTNLRDRKAGDIVNIECDIIGKYVEKLFLSPSSMKYGQDKRDIGMEFLKDHGFY